MLTNPDIAFLGPAGSGKTTAARYLEQHHGYRRLSIAGDHPGGLRDVVARIWGDEAVNDRERLDAFECMRAANPRMWLAPFWRAVDRIDVVVPVVVDDVRTPEEYAEVRAAGFALVRIQAGMVERLERLRKQGKLQTIEALGAPIHHYLDDSLVYPSDYTVYTGDRPPAETEARLVEIINQERRKHQ